MNTTATPRAPARLAVACILVALQSGCTSALTSAYLRDGLWGGTEHAAASPDDAPTARDEAPMPDAESGPVTVVPDRHRREAALEEAMSRLSRLGALDPAVEAALVATLQRTQPEDWPVVVEEFVGSLATAGVTASPPPAVAAGEPEPAPTSRPEPAPPADPAPAAAAAETRAEPESGEPTNDGPPVARAEASAPDPEPGPAAIDPPASAAVIDPPLAVRSACFASAVRAWGDVDRFAADRFRPGQDVIVYVELDNLSAGASPAGHTTCIDAVLRLVDDAGATLHTWTFDPVAETSATRRRDYFARYVVHVPESAPAGNCRVEVDVIDTRSGSTARAAIPLEIAAAD